MTGIDRRAFLELIGGAAGAGALAACQRPVECLVPVADRPEELVPGEPTQLATALHAGPDVCGVRVELLGGRPVKIEGNPKHPTSGGATNAFVQAELWQLLDPERADRPQHDGAPCRWEVVHAALDDQRAEFDRTRGAGLAIVVDETCSPTLLRLLQQLVRRWPEATVHVDDPQTATARAGLELLGVRGVLPHWRLDNAEVVAAFDCDLLHLERGALRAARDFAARRRVTTPVDGMSRWYAVEPSLTVTGAAADHRLPVPASDVELLLRALIGELANRYWLEPPTAIDAALRQFAPAALDSERRNWLVALGRDLSYHRGTSLVAVGHRQPARVHALAHLLNAALRNLDATVQLVPDPWSQLPIRDLASLVDALRNRRISSLLVLDLDVVQHTPVADLGSLIAQLPFSLYLGTRADATAQRCHWQLPASHALESWGDLRSDDGTATIVQPVIGPRCDSLSAIELLARLDGDRTTTGAALVQATWSSASLTDGDLASWLADGIVPNSSWPPVASDVLLAGLSTLPAAVIAQSDAAPPGIEIDFHLDRTRYDGRYANNPLLQELPDPITTQVWGNALLVGPTLATERGWHSGDVVRVTRAGQSVELPMLVAPGQAPGTVGVALGHGQRVGGRHCRGIGVDVSPLRALQSPWFAGAVELERTGRRSQPIVAQIFDAQLDRPTVRSADLDFFRDRPEFVRRGQRAQPDDTATSTSRAPRTRWAMVVDLNLCIGCGACVVACQVENNVAVVGPDQARGGRTMHWLRLHRYFEGGLERPRVLFQPLACQHCGRAPCESACPTAAAVAAPDGRNDQIYRRCIGARACLAACPYQVRRFNFAPTVASRGDGDPVLFNPEVSQRDRGVSEKCSYCVQRLNRARRLAHRTGRSLVDGEVQTACQQACPTRAIVFGDVAMASSVASRRAEPRSYALLPQLATQPASRFQARLFNPNPEIES